MTDLCLCDNIITRQRISEDNNLCPVCKKYYRDPEDSHTKNNNFNEELGGISENTKIYGNIGELFGISDREEEYINSPLQKDPFWVNKDLVSRDIEKIDTVVCSCENQQTTGKFCAECGDKTAVGFLFDKSESYYLESLNQEGIGENNGQLFGSVKVRPRANQRLFSIQEEVEGKEDENHLYSRIAIAGADIENRDLEQFADNYDLEDIGRLEILPVPQINREFVLIHNENQENLNNEVRGVEDLNLPVRDDIDNFEPREVNQEEINFIPHIYDDIVPADMDRRLQNIRPPRYDSAKANIRTFFTRFDKYKNAHQPAWDNEAAVNILSNLLDDESLEYFESLEEEIRNNYEQAKESLIEHYEPGNPIYTKWSNLTSRKQGETESVTMYYDDLIKKSRRMEVPAAQLLYIFIDGLPLDTKQHLALETNPPETLAQALTRAKTFQAVTKNGNPVKSLYKHIREESSKPSSAVVENTQIYKLKNLENTMEKLADKIDKIQVNSAQSAGNSQGSDGGLQIGKTRYKYLKTSVIRLWETFLFPGYHFKIHIVRYHINLLHIIFMGLHKGKHIGLDILVIKIVLLGIIIFGIITDKGFKIDRLIGHRFRIRGVRGLKQVHFRRTEIFHKIVVSQIETNMKDFQVGTSLEIMAQMHQTKIFTRNKDFLVQGIHPIKEIMKIGEILMVIGGIFQVTIINQDVIIF